MIDENIPPIPLHERTCINLMSSGISGDNGSHPVCLGRSCCKYEGCLYDLTSCALELDKIRRHPSHKRIMRHEDWGDRR